VLLVENGGSFEEGFLFSVTSPPSGLGRWGSMQMAGRVDFALPVRLCNEHYNLAFYHAAAPMEPDQRAGLQTL